MSCGMGRKQGTDPMLLGLWCRPAAAAPIQPLAWELPYAIGVTLKSKKAKKEKKKKKVSFISKAKYLCTPHGDGLRLHSAL